MARFWLATFMPPEPAATADATVAPILAAGSRKLAIEVLYDEAQREYAILFAEVDDLEQPSVLTCFIGFGNTAKACSVWRDRGFPLVDAEIARDPAGPIGVFSPHFGADHPMEYESLLFAMTPIPFEPQPDAPKEPATDYPPMLVTRYEQKLEAPDGAHPDTLIVQRAVTWKPVRRDVRRLEEPRLYLTVPGSRVPSLAPLEDTQALTPVSAWSGSLTLPQGGEGDPGPILGRVSRTDLFGPPAFRFEDVEVLGFRVDLGAYGRDFTRELRRLVKPLNFHLHDRRAIRDFSYQAATPTLLIELLRYGRMRLKSPSPPLGLDDYQSQHELVVRLLVGRVDEDTAQARDPATYVPAIFVDNPWSKVVGREVQGFDKRMASFCVPGDGGGHVRLLPDGRVARRAPTVGAAPGAGERQTRPLGDVSLVHLVEETGLLAGPKILELRYSSLDYADWSAFVQIGLDLTLSSLSLAGTRWRQSDFAAVAAEFSHSFALSAVTDSLRRLRSIQVSPVVEKDLGKAWITGTFTIDEDIRVALPSGTANLTIHAVEPNREVPSAPSAPPSWNLLCAMLGDGRRAEISLPMGSWYRLLCSMDLTIDDGLEWSRSDLLAALWT